MKTSLKEERLAQEMFSCVMPTVPWDHNVAILQSIYRTIAKKMLRRYILTPRKTT